MSRDDVANLVIRTFALWLGVGGLGTLGSMPWMIAGPGGRPMIVAYAFVLLGAAVILWLAAPALTRAMFARPDHDVPFALSAPGIPALASFVTGLYSIAAAVPQAFSWIVLVVMRRSMSASLMGAAASDAFDRRMIESGAQALAQLAVGAALIVLSRRRDLWKTDDITSPTPETPAS